jgi:dUTPase
MCKLFKLSFCRWVNTDSLQAEQEVSCCHLVPHNTKVVNTWLSGHFVVPVAPLVTPRASLAAVQGLQCSTTTLVLIGGNR